MSKYLDNIKTSALVIGIAGHKYAGKDSAARIIRSFMSERKYVVHVWRFADPLKVAVRQLFRLTPEQVEDEVQKEVMLPPPWSTTPRDILQRMGTEAMRGVFGGDFWVNCFAQRLEDCWPMPPRNMEGKKPCIIVPDVRYLEEVNFIKGIGGKIIRIIRPDLPAVDPHTSETALDDYRDFDAIVACNSGELAKMKEGVLAYMEQVTSARSNKPQS